jgi:hypothetical protein
MSRITPKIRLIRVNPEIVIKERSMRGKNGFNPHQAQARLY